MKKFYALLLSFVFVFSLGAAALALGVTSSLTPDNMADDGTTHIIYRDVGDTVTFTLTATDYVGTVTWRITSLTNTPVTQNDDFTISAETGTSVTVTGTVRSSNGYVIGISLNDQNFTTNTEDFTAQYDLWIQPSSYRNGGGSVPTPVPTPGGDSSDGGESESDEGSSSSKILPVAILEPVTLSEDVRSNIAAAMGVDASEVHSTVQSVLSSAQEPTQEIRDAVRRDRYTLAYKLDTVTVSEDGYYAFVLNVPEEYQGKKASDIRVYNIDKSGMVDSGDQSAKVAVVPGLLNGLGTMLDFDMMGLELDTLPKQILVVGLFQAGQPFSVYLARILLMLLGGCDMGAGLGIFGLIAVCGGLAVFKIFRRK